MSRLDLLVGPNGAGKTTFYEQILQPQRPGLPVVNADLIGEVRWPGHAMEHAYEAAAIAARTRAALIDARLDFCTETVFSHPSKLDLVRDAADAGYDVVLHVLMIPLEMCAHRVRVRVAAGGHDVPVEKLAGRYERLWPLIVEAVPRCHHARFWDNALDEGPVEVAAFRGAVSDYPPRWPAWVPGPLLEL